MQFSMYNLTLRNHNTTTKTLGVTETPGVISTCNGAKPEIPLNCKGHTTQKGQTNHWCYFNASQGMLFERKNNELPV